MKFLPGFKATFLIVGATFIILSSLLFAKGLIPSMAEFKVPETVLSSPHYFDALRWVYVHMLVIGMLIGGIGYTVTDRSRQKLIAVLLFLITIVYTWMDFRSSDSVVGNSLYQGPGSLAPAFISLVVTLLFLQISIRLVAGKKN